MNIRLNKYIYSALLLVASFILFLGIFITLAPKAASAA